jgi:hypothetical protein
MTSFALALATLTLVPRELAAQQLAVFQSETNTREYHGIYQEPLRRWLARRGEEFDVIGDATAADAAALAKYAVVLASSTYLVPDAAAKGLAEYAAKGGRLLWVDSPARCTDPALWKALGLDPGASYAPLSDCALRAKAPRHPAATSVANADPKGVVGNFATHPLADATVLYEVEGTATDGQRATYPAVILAQHGEGAGLCVNWVVWQNREPEVQQLLDDALDWLLADDLLERQPAVVRVTTPQTAIRQPNPVAAVVKLYRRASDGKQPAVCEATLRFEARQPVWSSTSVPLCWSGSDGKIDVGWVRAELSTEGLEDGPCVVSVQCKLADQVWPTPPFRVALDGELQARLRREQAERRKLLAPQLAGTLGDYDAEPRTPDGRVDIPRLLEQIETAHMNMYDWLLWHAPTDWEDFQRFLPLAKERNLKVWVTLCPPSEQGDGYPWSEPFRVDFLKWADEIGKLSKQYDNLVAMVIDDFWSGENHSLFTPDYIAKLVAALRAQNPKVAFLPTIYWGTIGDQQWIQDYGPLADGIVFPYAELETGDDLAEQLQACREWLGPVKFLMMNVYASGSSGSGEKEPRTAEYMRKVLTVSRQMCDGIRIYCLPKDKLLEDHRYAITAELYGKWRAEDKEGK